MSALFLTKRDVENKIVVETSGRELGTAQDIGFSLDGKIALVIVTKDGKESQIPVNRIKGVVDFIVIEPEMSTTHEVTTAAPQTPLGNCPKCQAPLKPGTRFCVKCGTKFA